jgi:preprotein translocase subunit SecA
MDLQECLLAAAIMNGVKLPEETKWRKRLKRRDARSAAPLSSDPFFQKMRDNWRKTGISEPPSPPKPKNSPEPAPGPVSLAAPDDQDVVQRIRNSAPKVGRNEPCPCGSGKKYKKCCGK